MAMPWLDAGGQRVMESLVCAEGAARFAIHCMKYIPWYLADTADLGLGGVILPTSAPNVFAHAAKLCGHVAAGRSLNRRVLNATALQFGTHSDLGETGPLSQGGSSG